MTRALGRYELVRPIARGGMAEVFLARRRAAGIEKLLVVKRIRAERANDARFRELFKREASLSMDLTHQNIVQTFDFGSIGDQFFLAMERVEGRDLGSTLGRVKEAPPSLVAAFIAAECCQALGYAHGRRRDGAPLGVVHRDVTLRNVLASWSGEVKLTDFGIATLAGEDTSKLVGTPAYMAPEQARSEAIDVRTDVYGVGMVLRELLTGERARPGEDREALVAAARLGTLAPWTGEVDPILVAICDRATAAKASDRYADAAEMHAELDAYIVAQRAARRDDSPARQLAAWLAKVWGDEREEPALDAGGSELSANAPMMSFLDDGAAIGTGTQRSLLATAADDAVAIDDDVHNAVDQNAVDDDGEDVDDVDGNDDHDDAEDVDHNAVDDDGEDVDDVDGTPVVIEPARSQRTTSSGGVRAKSDTNSAGVRAKSGTNSAGVRAKSDTNSAGVRAKADMNSAGVRAKSDTSSAGVRAKADTNSAGVRAKGDSKSGTVRSKADTNSAGVRAKSDTNSAGVRAKADTNAAGVRAKADTNSAGVRAKAGTNSAGVRAKADAKSGSIARSTPNTDEIDAGSAFDESVDESVTRDAEPPEVTEQPPRRRAFLLVALIAAIAIVIAFVALRRDKTRTAITPSGSAIALAPDAAADAAPTAVDAPAIEPADAAIEPADAASAPIDAAVRPPDRGSGTRQGSATRQGSGSAVVKAGSGSARSGSGSGSGSATTVVLRKVTINATPWAFFTVDGVGPKHQTPKVLELAPGPHQILFENDVLKVTRTITLIVPADRDMSHVEPLR